MPKRRCPFCHNICKRPKSKHIEHGPLAGYRIHECPKCTKVLTVLRAKGQAAHRLRIIYGTTRDRFYAETTTPYGAHAIAHTLALGRIPTKKELA